MYLYWMFNIIIDVGECIITEYTRHMILRCSLQAINLVSWQAWCNDYRNVLGTWFTRLILLIPAASESLPVHFHPHSPPLLSSRLLYAGSHAVSFAAGIPFYIYTLFHKLIIEQNSEQEPKQFNDLNQLIYIYVSSSIYSINTSKTYSLKCLVCLINYSNSSILK